MEEENKKPFDNAQSKETNNEPKIKEIHHHHYQKRGSFFSRLILGLTIIFLGIVLLGQNAGLFPSVQVWNLFSTFWPVFIIFAGLSVLSRGGWVLGIISTLVALALFALLFAGLLGVPMFAPSSNTSLQVQDHPILIERNPLANAAQVRVNFGAGKLDITGESLNLVEGTLSSNFLQPITSNTMEGTIQTATVASQGSWSSFGRYANHLVLNLSNTLPISLSVEAGASEINLDLREIVLTSLNMDAGASNIVLSLGDKSPQTDLSINSGASSLTISLPQNTGARINIKGGLSSKNFPGFTEKSLGVWESGNYSSATKKVNMNIEAGASRININWR